MSDKSDKIEVEVSDPGVLRVQVFSPPDGLGQHWSLPPGRYVIQRSDPPEDTEHD